MEHTVWLGNLLNAINELGEEGRNSQIIAGLRSEISQLSPLI